MSHDYLTDLQARTLSVVALRHKGSEISGAKIANLIGLRPRDTGKQGADMRSIINALRKKGYPICSNGKGYYYPISRGEAEEYAREFEGRIQKQREALAGIQDAIDHWDEILEIKTFDIVEI